MKKRIFFLLLLICLTVSYFSALTVDSAHLTNEVVDLQAKCSLRLEFKYEDKVFAEESVELYRVASISKNYIYMLAQEFASTGISLNGAVSKSEWTTIRTTLENYIAAENLVPLKVGFTDRKGVVVFDDLEPGMYFTSAVCTIKDNVKYYFSSVLSSLPNLKNGKPVYDVTVNAKSDRSEVAGERIKYKVSKLWKDTGKELFRPKNIEVQIFKDKELQETVILNEKNNWFYSWTAEDDGSVWSVAEAEYSGMYFVTIENRMNSFIIINQHESYIPPGDSDSPEPPSGDNVPPSVDPDKPDKPDKPVGDEDIPPSTDTPTGDTANMTLYITVLCFTGAALIIVSVAGNKLYNREENE